MTTNTKIKAHEDESEVEAKIIFLLGIYPVLSPTMLQAGLGPYTKPTIWRPIVAKLIQEGRIEETQESLQLPTGRYNTYTKLQLSDWEKAHAAG